MGNTCANLWNKFLIDKIGGWNEELINTQEYDLMFQLSKQSSNIAFSRGFFTIIHKTANSISFSNVNITSKRNNLLFLRIKIKSYLQSKNQFTLLNNYYYSAYIGTVLRYHKPDFEIHYSHFLFLIYKSLKSIRDRF